MTVTSEQVWADLQQQLRGFVGRRVANPADVDDVLQEIFVRIHTRIDTLEETDRLQAWVYQIARNVITDAYRAAGRRREHAVDVAVLDDLPEPAEDVEGSEAELAQCLAPLLTQLPASYRSALELTEFDGLTQQDAARQLGLSHSGMKSRVQRGRRQLRDVLLACCAVELDRRGGIIDYTVQQSGCGCDGACACQSDGRSGSSIALTS